MAPNADTGGHQPLVWGPAAEGERLSNGKTVDIPGWVWTCTCGASCLGHLSEDEADDDAERHVMDKRLIVGKHPKRIGVDTCAADICHICGRDLPSAESYECLSHHDRPEDD